jgi:alpha-L-fucosidase
MIESLCNCRRVGANYLMNVGPDEKGNVPLEGEFFLSCMRRWMEKYGEAVYDGRPYWRRDTTRNFILRSVDGKSVYFFVYGLNNRGSKHVVSSWVEPATWSSTASERRWRISAGWTTTRRWPTPGRGTS